MRSGDEVRVSRRGFLSVAAAGTALLGCAGAGGPAGSPARPAADPPDKDKDGEGEGEGEVTPAEDLMREHGVLRRIMFVYDDAARRLEAGAALPQESLAAAAGMIRRVIEDYHEKLEEQHLFPRFEKAGRLTALVATLRRQHQAGRELTGHVMSLTGRPMARGTGAELAGLLRRFNRMYRPHAAREDTVLFPALHGLVGPAAYREMGEQFEDIETRVLGPHGFERSVTEVAHIEQAFGLSDLQSFTP